MDGDTFAFVRHFQMGAAQSFTVRAEDACPVDHKNMSDEQTKEMLEQYKKTGVMQNMSTVQQPGSNSKVTDALDSQQVSQGERSQGDGCPVEHESMTGEQVAAYMKMHKRPNSVDVPNDSEKSVVYDVYGQELDRTNMMPATPNQLPSPGQTEPLSTNRVKSSIPKSGEQKATWAYPSEQMFYNAIMRKGKGHDVSETDMKYVVAAHNDTNEQTWEEVMDWEKRFHCDECPHPKLKSFMGRPDDLSPAARFRMTFLSYSKPFDRHDWIIDRCGKGEARYIIDYYSREAPVNVELHVRPALDSPTAFYDRIRHGLDSARNNLFGQGASPKVAAPQEANTEHDVVSGAQLEAEEFEFLSTLTPKGIEEIATDVQSSCANISEAFEEAGGDPEKLEKANVSANYCMARRICKSQAADFMTALETGGNESESYEKMTSCLNRFQIMARRTLMKAAGVVQSGPEFPVATLQSGSCASDATAASTAEGEGAEEASKDR